MGLLHRCLTGPAQALIARPTKGEVDPIGCAAGHDLSPAEAPSRRGARSWPRSNRYGLAPRSGGSRQGIPPLRPGSMDAAHTEERIFDEDAPHPHLPYPMHPRPGWRRSRKQRSSRLHEPIFRSASRKRIAPPPLETRPATPPFPPTRKMGVSPKVATSLPMRQAQSRAQQQPVGCSQPPFGAVKPEVRAPTESACFLSCPAKPPLCGKIHCAVNIVSYLNI